MTNFIATFLYIGHLRPAPGTWGSLAALPSAALIFAVAGPYAMIFAIIAFYVVGHWVTKLETAGSADHDPSEIVIDEVVGQWIALLPVLFGAMVMNVPLLALWPGWIAAFGLFRLFDILKPGPVGWADKRGDATGVMLDDVVAGIMAGIGVILLGGLYHVVLL